MITDEELHRYAANLIEDSGALFFGRVSYPLFERYSPSIASSGAGAEFARLLSQLDWQNSFMTKVISSSS